MRRSCPPPGTAADAIARLLAPRSVAVIGASADPGKTSGRPIALLRKSGYSGDIYPVNPRVESIDGLHCHPDIASLPAVPEVAIVVLGAERAQHAVAELAALGTTAAIVLAAGYAETGAEGAQRQRALLEAAGPMRLLGPNTIGLVNLTDRVVLSASGALDMEQFAVGSIGVVSQSGGILGSLLSRASARGIGLSKLISTSNEVDLDLADFIDYLADDPATQVIALYIESIRDPIRFRAAALKAARAGKPVVAFKVGRSEAGARAAASHTGALAGADRIVDALFRELGVIRAHAFGDLLDLALALSTGRNLRGRRVAILTSTGGAGTLVSDSLGVAGFETPPPDAATAARLQALLPGSGAVLDRNPIDVTLAGLQPEVLGGAIDAVFEGAEYDALVIVVGSSGVSRPALMADAIGARLHASDKPVIAYLSPHAPQAAALLAQRGVPAYPAAESCAIALDGMWRVRAWTQRERADVDDGLGLVSGVAMQVGGGTVIAPAAVPVGTLDEAQSKRLFAHFGIALVREAIVADAAQAQAAAVAFEGQVVLKLLSAQVTHKSDVGGVVVGLGSEQVGAALDVMREEVLRRTGIAVQAFLVQEQVKGGVELIVGMRRDPLGTAILVGMGGLTAELLDDTVIRLLPSRGGLEPSEVRDMLRELRLWPLLDGYRGRPKPDVDALVDAVVAFSMMAAQLGNRLLEAEINPLFVLAAGEGVRAADGVAVMAG